MIANGSVLVFDVQGTTGGFLPRTSGQVRADVIDGLTPFFEVQDVSIASSSFLSDPLHSLSEWSYRATVRAKVQADYADVRDVDSIVAHAFYEAAGELPTVTTSGQEPPQGNADARQGVSLTTALVLVAVALVAVVAIKAGV